MATQTVTIQSKARVKKTIGLRRNLIKNPSFEVGTTGWALDADFSRSNEDAYRGQYAVKHQSAGNYANFTTVNDANGIDVLPYHHYVLSFYYKMDISAGSGAQLNVNTGSAYGSSIAFLQMTNHPTLSRVELPFYTGANTKVWIKLSNNGGTILGFYDNFQIELGTVAGEYIDGDQPGGTWEGTANNSESYMSTIHIEARARVKKAVSQTITAKARINALVTNRTVQAKGRVKKTMTRTVTALASVQNVETYNSETAKAIRRIAKKVEVDWQLNDTFYNETDHLLSMEVERRISEPLGGISLGMADIQWVNHDDRYTPKD